MKRILTIITLLSVLPFGVSAQYTLNDWKIKDRDSITNEVHLNVKEYKLDFNHPLPYMDMQKCWSVSA